MTPEELFAAAGAVCYEVFPDLRALPDGGSANWFEIALHAGAEAGSAAFAPLVELAAYLEIQAPAPPGVRVEVSAPYFSLDASVQRELPSISLVYSGFSADPQDGAAVFQQLREGLHALGVPELCINRGGPWSRSGSQSED